MTRKRDAAAGDLLAPLRDPPPRMESLAPGAMLLRDFAGPSVSALVTAVEAVAVSAPFRQMVTPGGYRMSVAMTNCGQAGWIADRRGYRYTATDPATERLWPAMPPLFLDLAQRAAAAAGFDGFAPESCLINRYVPGTQLSLHQDRNERDYAQPIVSVSLGLPAIFLFGGLKRGDRPQRIPLESGDVVVWGGPSRLVFHGVAPLADGVHPLTGACRINLTLRHAL
jgi:alkylated DNA repair protein (DNA oxidative demethylase)